MSCAGWPRHRPPPHAAFRTRCTRTVQRVRSEAHYAAEVPRLARLAPGGRPGKTGRSAALPCWPFDSGQGNTTRRKRSPVLPTQCASERTLFFVLKSVRDAACGGDGPGGALQSKLPVSFLRAARGCDVLRGLAASPSAAARVVSDTLHSHRAACSLRGALRGGSAASGSACIVRQAGRNWTVRRPAFLLPSLPRRNGVGFAQRVWPAPHQVTGRVNRAVINALPFRIASACPFPSLLRGAILESNSQQKEAF